MPLIQNQKNLNNSELRSRPFAKKPSTLDREELEYSVKSLFVYSTLGLAAITAYVSIAYLIFKQLKKD
jgi:hypothetical protein